MTEVEHAGTGEEGDWHELWAAFQQEHPDEAAEVLRMIEGEAMEGLDSLPPDQRHQRLKDLIQERMRHGAPLLAVRRMHESLGKIAALPETQHPVDKTDSSNI